MSYYRKFKIIIGTPYFRAYLGWAYKKGIDDLKKLGFGPNFNKEGFVCLLCGVGNEGTADEFIKFATKRNKKSKIIIIDLNKEQIEAVNKLVSNKYPQLNIETKQINALKLNEWIKKESVDWIETDGFIEYFDSKSLASLLQVWRTILTSDGFITTRDFASEGGLDKIIDRLRIWLGKVWLGITLYPHSREELHKLFSTTGFNFVETSMILPTAKRYSLVKKQ